MTKKGKSKEPSPDKTYSRAEFAQIAQERGWPIDKGRGRGSHWWFRKAGEAPFPVPQKVEGPGLQENIKKALGIK